MPALLPTRMGVDHNPSAPLHPVSRRLWLQGLGATLLSGTARAQSQALSHSELGPVSPPIAAPRLRLSLHDGSQRWLAELLAGRLTAVHLMFTTCSSTCPIQGAVFAALQARLTGPLAEVQLLSISINPLTDDTAALARWRQQWRAGAQWVAAAPPIRQADAMLDFLSGGRQGTGADADRHTAQSYLFDRQGRLAYRCADLAGPADVLKGLMAMDRQG